jgi:hypothetical protein
MLQWRTRLGRLRLARLGALPKTDIWAPRQRTCSWEREATRRPGATLQLFPVRSPLENSEVLDPRSSPLNHDYRDIPKPRFSEAVDDVEQLGASYHHFFALALGQDSFSRRPLEELHRIHESPRD